MKASWRAKEGFSTKLALPTCKGGPGGRREASEFISRTSIRGSPFESFKEMDLCDCKEERADAFSLLKLSGFDDFGDKTCTTSSCSWSLGGLLASFAFGEAVRLCSSVNSCSLVVLLRTLDEGRGKSKFSI